MFDRPIEKVVVQHGKLPPTLYGQFKLDVDDKVLSDDEIAEKYVRKFMARGHTRPVATRKVEKMFKRYEKEKEEKGIW